MYYIETFLNSEFFPMFLRIFEFVFMTILFVKGEINVSKYAQTFTNLERRFILNSDGQVIPDLEVTDLQEEMNSHKDDCLSSFLDKYLDFSADTLPFSQDILTDGEYDMFAELVATNKADKMLAAYDYLVSMRERYNVPDHFSNEELVAYLREASKNGEMVSGPSIEKLYDLQKGGKSIEKETQTEQKSE